MAPPPSALRPSSSPSPERDGGRGSARTINGVGIDASRGRRRVRIGADRGGAQRGVAGVGGVLREVEAAGLWGVVRASPSRSVTGATGVGEAPSRERRVSSVHWRDVWGAGGGGTFLGATSERLATPRRVQSRDPQRSPPPPAPQGAAPRHTAHAALWGGGCSTPVAPVTDRGGGVHDAPQACRFNLPRYTTNPRAPHPDAYPKRCDGFGCDFGRPAHQRHAAPHCARPHDASMATPPRTADRLFAPRCTTLIADPHPDVPSAARGLDELTERAGASGALRKFVRSAPGRRVRFVRFIRGALGRPARSVTFGGARRGVRRAS
jgi:hypothetical protein